MSLRPGTTSQKRSVFAVHSTMTLSSPALDRKSRMSLRICSSWAGREGGCTGPSTWGGLGYSVPQVQSEVWKLRMGTRRQKANNVGGGGW